MLLSLIGSVVVYFFSWQLVDVLYPGFSKVLEPPLLTFFTNAINKIIPGQFSTVAEFQNAFNFSEISIYEILEMILGKISFEGTLSAGQILSPSLARLSTKVVLFFILFLTITFAAKVVKIIIKKMLAFCGLSIQNRVLGGILGSLKGVFLFILIILGLNVVSQLFLIEPLNIFLQTGKISQSLLNVVLNFIK